MVAALGLWIWSGSEAASFSSRVSVSSKDYEADGAPIDALVASQAITSKPARDPFLEPSESSPLPPTALPFPALTPLPVVALPLPVGQQPSVYHELRIDGAVEPFQFEDAGSAGVAVGAAAAEPTDPLVDEGAQAGSADSAYDRIIQQDSREIHCFIRSPDKYELALSTGVFPETIVYDWVSPKSGKILRPGDEIQGEEVRRVILADTLRNRIELRRRRLSSGPSSLPERRAFIEDLLREGRAESWVFEVAEEQAKEYVTISGGASVGYRLLVHVLRERGDLVGEWELYANLPADLRDSALAHGGKGELMARLGLDIDAEQYLNAAVQRDPADPHVRLAFARYLLQRNRPVEASVQVEAARRNRAVLSSAEEEFRMWATLISVKLALGETDVQSALSSMPTGVEFGARYDEIKAAVRYAMADAGAASELFGSAVTAGAGGHAALGMAASQAVLKNWAAARQGFLSVAAEHPLLRHRALAGLGLVYARTGNGDDAVSALEAATRAFPTDPYALYLLGRVRRQTGQLDSALEALRAALEQADDFVEAHAETALVYLAQADRGGDAAEALFRARRHIDRAVELDADRARDLRLLELQGVICFRATDMRDAREAFEAGADSSENCRLGLALVQYAQNRVQDARGMLTERRRALRTGDPVRVYVTETIARIDDHADKEQVRDGFEREDLGNSWEDQANDAVKPRPRDGVLQIRGRLGRPGREVFARRIQPTAGNFLQAEISLELGARDDSKDAVLEVATQTRRGRSEPDFRARIGFREQSPQLLIEDGDVERARDDEERARWDPVALDGVTASPGEQQRLILQVVPREDSGKFSLRAFWNGALVHERPIEKLHAKTKTELTVSLLVAGSQGAEVDVKYDDFRLVRRREK